MAIVNYDERMGQFENITNLDIARGVKWVVVPAVTLLLMGAFRPRKIRRRRRRRTTKRK